jgi:hypothetical protein
MLGCLHWRSDVAIFLSPRMGILRPSRLRCAP